MKIKMIKKKLSSISESRKHVYKIWKQGRNNINVLNDFLDKIEKEYQKKRIYIHKLFLNIKISKR